MIFPTLRSSFLWIRRAALVLQTSLLAPFLLTASDAEAATEFMRVQPKIVISGSLRMADNYLFSGDFDNAGTASAALRAALKAHEWDQTVDARLVPFPALGTLNGQVRYYTLETSYNGAAFSPNGRGSFNGDGRCNTGPGWSVEATSTGNAVTLTCVYSIVTPNPGTPPTCHPVFPDSGMKYLPENDYVDPKGLLSYSRTYRSDHGNFSDISEMFLVDLSASSGTSDRCYRTVATEYGPDGVQRQTNYCFPFANTGAAKVHLYRKNGNRDVYSYSSGIATPLDPDNKRQLTRLPAGATLDDLAWKLQENADTTMYFDGRGKLRKRVFGNGQFLTYTYSTIDTPTLVAPKAGLLLEMKDQYNRSLQFVYNPLGLVSELTDPAGGKISYQYGEASGNCPADEVLSCRRLTSVTYQDGKTRRYHFNESSNVPASLIAGAGGKKAYLTGLTDENDVRLGNYKYDASGRVVSSGWGGNDYLYAYGSAQTTITNPSGAQNVETFLNVAGSNRLVSTSQPAGSGCIPAVSKQSHDGYGNVISRTDWNGIKTDYTYEIARGLETKRIEAVGTADARTVTTEWFPTMAFEKTVAEPKRITSYERDANGRVLTQSVQATTDLTGSAGLAATKVGIIRKSVFTYNELGQILTSKGPRTDIDDTTVFAYDAQGNLETETNALGHVTRFSDYDAHGHVRRMTGPNNVVTTIDYYPRGWVRSRTVTAQGINRITSYEYDGVGQLTKTILPDNSTMNYVYDNVHRLADIYDSLGNTIHYTLDAMGNRTKEEVKDSTGALTLQVNREFDALNRLKLQTGVAQ
jgi:YD repeat-containing protein